MPLTPQQKQVAENWLKTKAAVSCPQCGDNVFTVEDLLAIPVFQQAGPATIKPPTNSIAYLSVRCDNCANVSLFSAALMGIAQPASGSPTTP
jgi:ribosomal protein S27E